VIKNKKERRKHKILLHAIMLMVAFALAAGISSCSQTPDTTKKPEPAQKAAVTPPIKKAPAAGNRESSSADEEKAVAEITYDPAGKPDPFAPLVTAIPSSKQAPQASLPESELTPLQKYDLSELKLVAIILQSNVEPTAMVEDKSGYGYVIKKGMQIGKNNGIIREITANEVIVDEKTVDAAGAEKTETSTLTITNTMLGEK
jgi:type IV pilus assembly protein PilP